MGLNFKKIFSIIFTAQLLYSITVVTAHIFFAKSISGFWHGELLAHFLHYEMAAASLLIVILIFRKNKKAAGLTLALILITTFALYKKSRPHRNYHTLLAHVGKDYVLQLICFNGNSQNETKVQTLAWLKTKVRLDIPTVFVLLEATEEWAKTLSPIEKTLPHTTHQLREDNFGFYIASNIKLDTVKFENFTQEDISAALGHLQFAGKTFSFAAVHPVPPISNYWFLERESYLKGVKNWLVSTKKPAIVCGDFNTTAWTQSYDNFRAPPSPLKDTFWGPLRPLTWGVLGLYTSIDFIFYAPEFELIYANTGAKMGSDHALLYALLRWK